MSREGEFKKRIKKGIQVFPDGTYDDEPLYEMVDEAKKEFPWKLDKNGVYQFKMPPAKNLIVDLIEWFEKWFGKV